MGRVILDTGVGGDFPPTAEMRELGAMLKGTIVRKEERDLGFGTKPIYVFKVIDASCKFTVGKERKEVQPEEGALIEVIAPTRLARQLAQLKEGDVVTMINAGTKKVGRGKPAHVFDVVAE